MRILIATDSFKGSLTSLQAADAIEAGIKRACARADCQKTPVADGGEGTLQALIVAVGGELRYQTVVGPMGQPVKAAYLLLPDGETAVVEMAAASGLALVGPEARDPSRATSYGTGELIRSALQAGAGKIICGLGGSATIDGGMGMAQALGYRFLDVKGNEISAQGCGGLLEQVSSVDTSAIDNRVLASSIMAACDVQNPVLGEQGSVRIYGPQKGATEAIVQKLEHDLGQFCRVAEQGCATSATVISGAGAAGGLGFALKLFAGAELVPGFQLIAKMIGLEKAVANSNLVITGEGQIDAQTEYGKVPLGVAELAQRHNVPVVAIGGGLAPESRNLFQHGFSGLEASITELTTEEKQLENASARLSDAAERVMRLLALGQQLAPR